MQTVSTAKAKIVLNRKFNTVRIIVAFNPNRDSEGGYRFPPQRDCAYASGDMLPDDVEAAATRISRMLNAELQFVG